MDAFVERPVSGPIPAGRYQCPACNAAWRLQPPDCEDRQFKGLAVIPADPLL